MKEREIFLTVLSSQEQLAAKCGNLATACTTPQLRDTVWRVLQEEYQIQGELADECKKRGWMVPQPASGELVSHLIRTALEE